MHALQLFPAQMPRKAGRKKGSHHGSGHKRKSPDSSGAWPGASEDASSSGAWPDESTTKKFQGCRRRASKAKESRKSADSTESGPWPKDDASRSSGAWSESGKSEGPGVQEAAHATNAEDLIVRGALKRETWRKRKDRKRATRATNVGRIQELLQQQTCPECGKEGACTKVNPAFAQAAAETYWSMSDEERAMIMYNMYSEASGRNEKTGKCSFKHVSWMMGAVQVCFRLFCAILGTNHKTIRKYVNGTWGPKVMHAKEKSASHFVDFSSCRCTSPLRSPCHTCLRTMSPGVLRMVSPRVLQQHWPSPGQGRIGIRISPILICHP